MTSQQRTHQSCTSRPSQTLRLKHCFAESIVLETSWKRQVLKVCHRQLIQGQMATPIFQVNFVGGFHICRWFSCYLGSSKPKLSGAIESPSYALSNVLYRYIPATLPVVYRCVQHHSKLKAVEYLCSWKLRLFTGGYNTRIHGSFEGGQINAIQIESARDHREDPVRDEYARAIAAATVRYLDTHYP